MGIEKKLLVFNLDKLKVRAGSKLLATDYYCALHMNYKEKVPAKKFYSANDDETKFPYCLECIDYLRSTSIFLED